MDRDRHTHRAASYLLDSRDKRCKKACDEGALRVILGKLCAGLCDLDQLSLQPRDLVRDTAQGPVLRHDSPMRICHASGNMQIFTHVFFTYATATHTIATYIFFSWVISELKNAGAIFSTISCLSWLARRTISSIHSLSEAMAAASPLPAW